MKDVLEQIDVPNADAARSRSRDVVVAAFLLREPVPPRRRGRAIAIVAILGVVAVVLAAVSPPGMAVVDRVREVVGVERATPALFSLPAPGRLLVASDAGVWVVARDGGKRLLSGYREARWSPFGRFLVALRRDELAALEPDGVVRWTLARPRVTGAAWGGSERDTRIAYADRTGLRVVAGDGTSDRVLEPSVRGPFVWRPGGSHVLAYVSAGEVRVQNADSRRVLWQSRGVGAPVRALAWSTDGRRLLVVTPLSLRLYDVRGRLLEHHETSGDDPYTDAAFMPATHRVIVLRGGSDVLSLATGRTLFRGSGLASVMPAPGGTWLLVSWPRADQWIFVGPHGALRAVSGITEQFRSRSGFPRIEGWCCS